MKTFIKKYLIQTVIAIALLVALATTLLSNKEEPMTYDQMYGSSVVFVEEYFNVILDSMICEFMDSTTLINGFEVSNTYNIDLENLWQEYLAENNLDVNDTLIYEERSRHYNMIDCLFYIHERTGKEISKREILR